jgi:hypothetical protein
MSEPLVEHDSEAGPQERPAKQAHMFDAQLILLSFLASQWTRFLDALTS